MREDPDTGKNLAYLSLTRSPYICSNVGKRREIRNEIERGQDTQPWSIV